jgi:diguanylate cyclase (GGDEF)-like protein/PAS domain S-box-containing protein
MTLGDLQIRGGRLEQLIFLLVMAVVMGVWALVVVFSLHERATILERATSQLSVTVSTLADFNELSAKVASADEATATRAGALWRALLQYPTANIWVEQDGAVAAGESAESGRGPYIFVEESRGSSKVHAALPVSDVLAEWRSAMWWRAGMLTTLSIVLVLMTHFLLRALHQRSAMEQKALITQERSTQLVVYQTQLEERVAARTNELRDANAHLAEELLERTAAENALREHDALLNAVTRSASELLGANSYADAIAVVLELIAQTLMVGRVQLNSLTPDQNGHLRLTVAHEWCVPEAPRVIDNPLFREVDITALFPKALTRLLGGNAVSFSLQDIPEPHRPMFEKANMCSFLQIPVVVNSKLWGMLSFIDSLALPRKWSWAETDALKTLGGVIGVAIMRARFVKELADANMIVQNSPTILYRLRAEPSFPLVYVSQNITKFGYVPQELLKAQNWSETLIDPEDRGRVGAAMTQLLEKDAQGGTIEFRLHKGDGSIRWVEDRYAPVRDKLGRLTEIEGIIIDVTERKLAEERMVLLARTDGLTGLANRATFVERLHQTFALAKRGGGAFAVLYLDLDHFKDVNDSMGHPTGDLLLKEVAKRLKTCTRENDLIARLGGDEFAVLQTETGGAADAGELANRITHALSAPYQLANSEIRITVSVGVCPFADTSVGPDVMLSQADLALYRAKDQGRDQYRFHSEDLDREVLARVTLSDELRKGIERDELQLFYQPQVELFSGRIAGVEALVRWQHPVRGLLQPSEFLAIAEQTGTIVALGRWVFDKACQQMRLWRDEHVAPASMTINLSLPQLRNSREAIQDITKTVEKWGLEFSDFEFDVTEATIAHLTWTQNDVLSQLHKLGVRIAIDNFGTEYSSFEYLRSYNVNHLKIARSLVACAVQDPERGAMIRVMINMARELGIGIMAEGVETEEQRALFMASGTPTKAQGFYFSGPVEAARAGELLRQEFIRPVRVSDEKRERTAQVAVTKARVAQP